MPLRNVLNRSRNDRIASVTLAAAAASSPVLFSSPESASASASASALSANPGGGVVHVVSTLVRAEADAVADADGAASSNAGRPLYMKVRRSPSASAAFFANARSFVSIAATLAGAWTEALGMVVSLLHI
jgi:hypothetical protein